MAHPAIAVSEARKRLARYKRRTPGDSIFSSQLRMKKRLWWWCSAIARLESTQAGEGPEFISRNRVAVDLVHEGISRYLEQDAPAGSPERAELERLVLEVGGEEAVADLAARGSVEPGALQHDDEE